MKHRFTHHSSNFQLIAMLILVMALVSCNNEVTVGPTEPHFGDFSPTVGALRTLNISGTLAAEQGSCLKATILFNGQEIHGARTKCHDNQGCVELHLAGVISAPVGNHTITFKVLRQSADIEEYVAAGSVEVSRFDLQLPSPAVVDLEDTQASLAPGEGITFDLALWD